MYIVGPTSFMFCYQNHYQYTSHYYLVLMSAFLFSYLVHVGIALSEAPYAEVYDGVWGFNGMLSAGALGGFCYVVTWQSTLTTLACVVFTTVLQKCLMMAFQEVRKTTYRL